VCQLYRHTFVPYVSNVVRLKLKTLNHIFCYAAFDGDAVHGCVGATFNRRLARSGQANRRVSSSAWTIDVCVLASRLLVCVCVCGLPPPSRKCVSSNDQFNLDDSIEPRLPIALRAAAGQPTETTQFALGTATTSPTTWVVLRLSLIPLSKQSRQCVVAVVVELCNKWL